MARHKTEYELGESQVVTPERVVSLFWDLVHPRRPHLGTVLDMGAGDCRFAAGGRYGEYVGVEIDLGKTKGTALPRNCHLVRNCVFRHQGRGYDACIGNPPYVRHHDIEPLWKEKTAERIERDLGVKLDKHCNLYVYFMCLGLMKTHTGAVVALVVPFEWVSRPSCRALREHIERQGWDVEVYRFAMPVFESVLTTASITIIDKRTHTGKWAYFDVLPTYEVVRRRSLVASRNGVLDYEARGDIWAMRGLSPGSQRVFTLTEGERVHFGLTKRDVVPCVTTLKSIPCDLRILTASTLKRYFVDAGERCWLIKSYQQKRSTALEAYLAAVPERLRNTYTCHHQDPWFKYTEHPVPRLLISSAFTRFGPKVLVNSVEAHAVGSVCGIYGSRALPTRRLQEYLLGIDFERQVVAHAKTLRKVEVGQFNAALNAFIGKGRPNGRKRT